MIYTETLHATIMLFGSTVLMVYAFGKVGGYKQLQHNYIYAIPGKISEGNWTAKSKCYIPHSNAFHLFLSSSSGDFSWPELIFGATTLSLFYGSADQVSVLRALAGKNISHIKIGFILYGYLKLLPMFLVVMPGMISRTFYPETAYSEKLFEYMLMTRSCLTPPITALFILAVFSKRVNEEGAFWGLSFGIMIGFCRMLPELIYGHRTCEDQKCPQPFCSIRYLYFSMPLLVVSLISMLVISFFRHPIPEIHLHRLCWSLRKSQDERVDLDQDRTWKRLPRFPATPTMFRHSQSYFWEALQLYFGLEPQLKSTVTPKKASKEINATEEKVEATRKRKYSDALEGEEDVEQHDISEDSVVLDQGELSGKRKATKEKVEHTKRGGMLENSSMKRVISASGTILITLVVLGHVYFA